MLRDDDLGAALVELGDDVVAVKSLVRDQHAKLDPGDERWNAAGIAALSGQQNESEEVAERVGEGKNFVC